METKGIDKSFKIVRINGYNNDQELLGFFNTEQHAKDNIPYLARKYSNWIKSEHELLVKPTDPEMIFKPVNTDYNHFIRSLIPNKEWERVMRSDASAEIHADNMVCGGATYYYLSRMIPKRWTVIDFGCAYNPQSYLFQEHAKYVGVEMPTLSKDFDFEFFQAPNTDLIFTTGQKFILDVLPTMNLDLTHVFAICNYVPSSECCKMVRETFPNCFTFYPA